MSTTPTCPERVESDVPKMEAVVLVVSPDDRLLKWLDICWADFTLHLLHAASCEEAEKLVQVGDPDLVFVHGDPCPNVAVSACESLRKLSPQCSVFLVRSAHEITEQLRFIRLGCDGILPFPPDPSQIAQVISAAAVRRKSREPALLWVDDDADLLDMMAPAIQTAGFRLLTSARPLEIFELLTAHAPDILMLDYRMPGVNGAELCRMVRLRSEYRALPILILSASSEAEIRRKCLEAGADDYVLKPINVPDLLARLQAKVIRGQMLRTLATQDPLTQLNNHQAFLEILFRECNRAVRYNAGFSLAVLDVDRFSEVNRKYSFTAGDEVLRRLASALRERFRRSDASGRIGVDRFALVLPEIDKDTAVEVIKDFVETAGGMSFPALAPGTEFSVSLRAAVARFPADGSSPRALLSNALTALQTARDIPAPRVLAYRPKK